MLPSISRSTIPREYMSVFGDEELVNTFKDKLTQTYENAKVISEDGIV